MLPHIAAIVQGDNPTQGAYDGLPEAIKQYYTPRQWSFMSDDQKTNVVRDNCEPEC